MRILSKVVMVGNIGAGKTKLRERFVDKPYSDGYKSTIGVAIDDSEVQIDENTVAFQFVDIAGQESYQKGTTEYSQHLQSPKPVDEETQLAPLTILVCIDIDVNRKEQIEETRALYKTHCEGKLPKDAQVYLVCTKNDSEKKISEKEIQHLAKQLKIDPANIIYTSSKTDEGRVVEINQEKCGVSRDSNNQLHVVSAVCTHMKCIVNWNNAEKTWDCPCHGSRFTQEGKVIEGPAKQDLEKRKIDK